MNNYAQYQNYAYPAPLSRKEIMNVRHKAELPLFAICVIITAMVVLAALFISNNQMIAMIEKLDEYLEYLLEDEASETGGVFEAHPPENGMPGAAENDEEGLLEDDEEFDLLLTLIVGAIGIFIVVYLYYAYTRAYAIKVSERNFPEIHNKSVEYAKRLGLKKVPPVYIEQHDGMINAFASAVLRKPYAMLTAELVDVAYMEHRDFDAVYFVLAHEFAHIYFRHVSFTFVLLTAIPHLIPVFGPLHSRSMEYSCDRLAQLLMGCDCVQEAMILSAGRHLYKYVDTEDYLLNAKKEKGLFLWIVNFMASHPIMPKRIAALADPRKRSGKLIW